MNNYFAKIYSKVAYAIFILVYNLLPAFLNDITYGIVWGIVGFPCVILVPIDVHKTDEQRQIRQFHNFDAHVQFIALGIELATNVTKSWLFRHRYELTLFIIALTCSLFLAESDIPLMLALGGAALMSSIAGFAFSAIAGAILFHLSSDTIKVLELMICCSIANQCTMVYSFRHEIAIADLTRYLPSGALGVVLGVSLVFNIDSLAFKHFIGGFLVTYSILMLLRNQLICRTQKVGLDITIGFLSGIVGGLVGFPGAFLVPWLALKGWDKQRQRCLYQPFILIMQIIALTVISLVKHNDGKIEFDLLNLLFIPFSLFCTSLGMLFYGKLSDKQFGSVINGMLMISGIAYLL